MPAPYWIEPNSGDVEFPDVSLALTEPDGLLAIGGDLTSRRLLSAYRSGIFPWYSEDQPLLWWSPNPRYVLFPEQIKISRSLRKTLRQQKFTISINRAFDEVIQACAETPRAGQDGTWITSEMYNAYTQLHRDGYAHSVEAWKDNKLVGGLYGIEIGKVFFGESMFSKQTDASKAAFVHFVKHLHNLGLELIDCQVHTAHLESLGALPIPRNQFIQLLNKFCDSENLLSNDPVDNLAI
jgi:leucyl/phenylalanyl-tRNA--protein transferase